MVYSVCTIHTPYADGNSNMLPGISMVLTSLTEGKILGSQPAFNSAATMRSLPILLAKIISVVRSPLGNVNIVSMFFLLNFTIPNRDILFSMMFAQSCDTSVDDKLSRSILAFLTYLKQQINEMEHK